MKKIEIKCNHCGKTVLKPAGEYNRRIKLNKTKFYCNNKCSSSVPEVVEKLISNKSNYNISNHSSNRRDNFSDFRWYMKTMRMRTGKVDKFDIDLQYLKDLWESQKGICPFTKEPITLRTHTNCKEKILPYTASIDRIDCSKGYIKGNIRFISLIANFARNNFTDEDVIDFCKKVTNNS